MSKVIEDFKKRRRGRELQTCAHFNGVQHEKCDAGVSYAFVAQKNADGPGRALPCLPGMNGAPCLDNCAKKVAQTTADLDAQEAEISERFAKIAAARKAIVTHAGPFKKGVSKVGSIPCPACGGAGGLSYSRSGYNGHIHAGCTTAGCVSWME